MSRGPITPLFSTSPSRQQGGIFTVEKAKSAKEWAESKTKRGPVSLCELAVAEKLKRIHLVESNFINLMNAYKNLKASNVELSFGLKLTICEDMSDKNDASLRTESKVILWLAKGGSTDYERLISIFSHAANEGFYYVPRLDWKTLGHYWSDDLLLTLPFYSSFLARNTLTFASIVPELPAQPLILREIGQELAVDELINGAIDRYVENTEAEVEDVKSLYYRDRKHAKQWLIWQGILRHESWDVPNMDGCTSREFSWESFKELST